MRDKEQELAQRIAPLIRCARKMVGYEQQDLATLLDVTQATISRIENGILSISAYNWLQVCELGNIELDSLNNSYIESMSPTKLKNTFKVGKFKIPRKYGKEAGTKIREFAPLIESFKEIENWEKVFKKKFKIDSDYLYNLDHVLNMNFVIDFISYLKEEKLFKKSLIENNLKILLETKFNKKLSREQSLEKLFKYLNADFIVQDDNKVVQFTPKTHLKDKEFPYKDFYIYNGWMVEFLTKHKYIAKTEGNTLKLSKVS